MQCSEKHVICENLRGKGTVVYPGEGLAAGIRQGSKTKGMPNGQCGAQLTAGNAW